MTTSTRRLRRSDVVDTALQILARVGLPDLTMRALGTELGVQQSALYHHVENKQALLGAVADEILAKHDENYMPPEVMQALEKSGMMQKHNEAKAAKQGYQQESAQ